MSVTRLALYNIATRFVGERPVDALTENTEARKLLDEVYTTGDGAVRYLLEQGNWNFAMRAVEIDSSDDVDPAFGWSFAFAKPTDLVRLNQISSEETFNLPLNQYELEGSYIYANVDPLYLRFVSDDTDWGGDLSKWSPSFALYAGSWLGTQIASRLTSNLDLEKLEKRLKRLLVDAQSKDALQERTRFPPLGNWASSRMGPRSRRDRGNRSRLIG